MQYQLVSEISPEMREKQQINGQIVNTSFQKMVHGAKTKNEKLLTQARVGFEEVLDAAAKDPQAVSNGSLLGALYYLARFYFLGLAVTQDYDTVEKLLLRFFPLIKSSPKSLSPYWFLNSCLMMASISLERAFSAHKAGRSEEEKDYIAQAEQFYRKILAYNIQHPDEIAKDEAIRGYVFSAQLALSDLLARKGDDQSLKEALSFYQSAYRIFQRFPSEYFKKQLSTIKQETLLPAIHAYMSTTTEDIVEFIRVTGRPKHLQGRSRQELRI